ncbi:kynureninase [Vitiosangium sp. GDMCC 1.1324]|uniref:kynureninase n=1 Tax=Vitiosangium sp. (strain GDMCC 1.1324) TaxID=2138576 RepID=UPI000D345E7E|nr:kynureninase [Vitiosangium sp. GDMCC 1.1324]PTL84445.1 kynureninase [Vitiosangium sp. GDMCC 1.1324]
MSGDVVRFEASEEFARRMDAEDALRPYREEFLFPDHGGEPAIYFVGNSLGLQPRKAKAYVLEALEDWEKLGVEGHFRGAHPWMPYHEFLTEQTARLVGAHPLEVVVMNTLSVNLHLMLVSFYRPTPERPKILMEAGAFPSDQYAVASQVRFHGFDPERDILRLAPRPGEETLRPEDILETLERHGREIALVLLGNVNYLTGQAFDMAAISRAAHKQGCRVGFDLAHGAGNLQLSLHDDGPDFAVWCSYKYLNGGPGTLGGVFVHERHARDKALPRFAGWWGHDKQTRFQMGPDFDPMPGAEGWMLSNPPILQLAALRASMELFDRATMPALRRKSERLTGYLEFLLDRLPPGFVRVITPRDSKQRGAQLSLRFSKEPRRLLEKLNAAGIHCDFRSPDVIRAAPAPLYTSFHDVYRFAGVLERHARD